MLFYKKVIVGDQENALVTRRGRFLRILEPGTYRLFGAPWTLGVETYRAGARELLEEWVPFLLKEHPDVVAKYFTLVETRDTEVALVSGNGLASRLIGPGRQLLYFQNAGVTAEVFDGAREVAVPANRLAMVERMGATPWVTFATVLENQVGLLFVDNRFVEQLRPGKYGFLNTAGEPRVEVVEVRRQSMEVPGQEILTRDKVSLRVNVVAVFRVTDPVTAKTGTKDWAAALYQTVQLAVRQSLGKRTLEQILDEKTDVDAGVLETVRAEMEKSGVRVESIALKDIVLPGEMREMLNRVVAAEKEAQANLIRRREETAATRSLLNTAKLMEDNPVLVRLKELETLEKLTAKVDKITVAGGFDGLLEGLLTRAK